MLRDRHKRERKKERVRQRQVGTEIDNHTERGQMQTRHSERDGHENIYRDRKTKQRKTLETQIATHPAL
jgi:hypothetical protein